jgi:hypothetical protein
MELLLAQAKRWKAAGEEEGSFTTPTPGRGEGHSTKIVVAD